MGVNLCIADNSALHSKVLNLINYLSSPTASWSIIQLFTVLDIVAFYQMCLVSKNTNLTLLCDHQKQKHIN